MFQGPSNREPALKSLDYFSSIDPCGLGALVLIAALSK